MMVTSSLKGNSGLKPLQRHVCAGDGTGNGIGTGTKVDLWFGLYRALPFRSVRSLSQDPTARLQKISCDLFGGGDCAAPGVEMTEPAAKSWCSATGWGDGRRYMRVYRRGRLLRELILV
jgi:hypothetical protein